MINAEIIRRIQLRETLMSELQNTVDERISRYLAIEHQGIIGAHFFSEASTECVYLYRDGYFIGTVMMSHAINEGIMKFIAQRKRIDKQGHETLINVLLERKFISEECAAASNRIWRSYRNDIHHMNPTVAQLDFRKYAENNIQDLATIEKEIFGFSVQSGAVIPDHPDYWDTSADGTIAAHLRLE